MGLGDEIGDVEAERLRHAEAVVGVGAEEVADLAHLNLTRHAGHVMKEGHCLAGQALQFCRLNGFAPRVSFRSAQIETVLAFVAAGWGVSIVPAMARAVETNGVRYRSLAGMMPSMV